MDLILTRGAPEYLRADNGHELIAWALRDYCRLAGTNTAYIEPGSPRLAGALPIEQNDEWLVCRRYLSAESMSLLDAVQEDTNQTGEEVFSDRLERV